VFRNEPDLAAWRHAVRAGIPAVAYAQLTSEHGARRRRAVERLLCQLEFPASSAQDGLESAYERLARHDARGWVQTLSDRIVVTDAGRHALPLLCSELYEHPAAALAEGSHWLS
jgi:oxygen-independent coproporphyrinogen-3 oxidase